jgi:hypothetical protein
MVRIDQQLVDQARVLVEQVISQDGRIRRMTRSNRGCEISRRHSALFRAACAFARTTRAKPNLLEVTDCACKAPASCLLPGGEILFTSRTSVLCR